MIKSKQDDLNIPLIENSLTKQYKTYSSDNVNPSLTSKGRFTTESKKTMFESVGAKLAYRKSTFYKKKVIADLSLLFAMLGILIMIIDTEIGISGMYGPNCGSNSIISLLIKMFVTLSTVILLGFLIWYHKIAIQLFMIDNSIEIWHLAISPSTILGVSLEIVICSIHPMPLYLFRVNNALAKDNIFNQTTGHVKASQKEMTSSPVNVVLGLVMFLRVYLVCRVIMLHSRIYQDASAQSIGALNRIHFNFKFIFKSLMNLYPEYVLTLLIFGLFVWASWALRACEIYHFELRNNFFNCMWLVAITFLSVGYGEIVPESYCGRSIAVLTGIFGAGCTALVVAVLARKLELSRDEKYVHNFVIDVELDKQLKHAAINVIKEGWLVFKYKRSGTKSNALQHQRRLLRSIRKIRDLKNKRRRLADNAVNLLEIYHSQGSLTDSVQKLNTKLTALDGVIKSIDVKLVHLLEKSERKK